MSDKIRQIASASEFDTQIAQGTTLVDFWAPWCGPCRQQLPILDRVAAAFEGRAVVAKVNVDEQGELAARFGVDSIPALFIFRDQKPVEQFVGVQEEKTLSAALEKALKG